MSATNDTNSSSSSFDLVFGWDQYDMLPIHVKTTARYVLQKINDPSESQVDMALDLLTHHGGNHITIRSMIEAAGVDATHLAYEYLRETGAIGGDGEPDRVTDPDEFKKFSESLRIIANIIVKTGAETIEGLIAVLRAATGEDDAWRFDLKWLNKQVDKWLAKKAKEESEE